MKRQDFDKLHDDPIHFCIIGHTNHGKTTTIRTLANDESIGVVAPEANVTPGVEPYRIHKDLKTQYWVYDTAGFSAFGKRMLDAEQKLGYRPNIQEFVDFLNEFKHDDSEVVEHTRAMAGSLQKVMECHLAIVVIDSREPCTKADYLEEIDFLSTCGTPLVVSLNRLHSKNSKPAEWRSQLMKHGITNIVEFDAHVRTRTDERNLFRSLEALSHSQLHKDFIDYWIKSLERVANEKDLRAIESIKAGILSLAGLSIKKSNLTPANVKLAQKQAVEEFQELLANYFRISLVNVLACYEVQEKHIALKSDTERQAVESRPQHTWLPNWFKAGTTGGATATVATIELLTGGVTLGIPTVITAFLTYGGTQLAEVQMNPEGTDFAVAISDDQLIQFAGCLMEQSQRARVLGRGAFPSASDPDQTIPFQIDTKSKVFATGPIREAVLTFAKVRPKRCESHDDELMSILTSST